MNFIRGALADGPRASVEVKAEALENGIAEKTYSRARSELGVEWQPGKRDLLGKWQNMMKLPENQNGRKES